MHVSSGLLQCLQCECLPPTVRRVYVAFLVTYTADLSKSLCTVRARVVSRVVVGSPGHAAVAFALLTLVSGRSRLARQFVTSSGTCSPQEVKRKLPWILQAPATKVRQCSQIRTRWRHADVSHPHLCFRLAAQRPARQLDAKRCRGCNVSACKRDSHTFVCVPPHKLRRRGKGQQPCGIAASKRSDTLHGFASW